MSRAAWRVMPNTNEKQSPAKQEPSTAQTEDRTYASHAQGDAQQPGARQAQRGGPEEGKADQEDVLTDDDLLVADEDDEAE